MSIKLKLIFSSLVTILGIVAVAAVGLYSLERTRDNINQLTSQSTPLQVKTLEFQKMNEQLVADFFKLSLAEKAEDAQRYTAAIDSRLSAIDALKEAIRKLNPDSKLDAALFRDAARTTAEVVGQRLKDLGTFNDEASKVNKALREIETTILGATTELAQLSGQSVKGVSDAQTTGARANATVKKLLTIQARLKDIELLVGAVDSVQNRFRLPPIRERLKAVADSVQAVKQEADDPAVLKEIKDSAIQVVGLFTRDGNGLMALRAEVLAKKDVESDYAAVRKSIVSGLEGLGSKLSELVDPIEITLLKEKQKIERALDMQIKSAVILAAGNAITVDSKETKASMRLLMLAANDRELQESASNLAGLGSRMQQGIDKVRVQLRDLGQARLAGSAGLTAEAIKNSTTAMGRIIAAKASVLKSERKMHDLMEQIKTLVAEQSKQGEARIKATAQGQADTVKEVNDGVRDAVFTMLVISGVLAALIIGMSIVITLSVTRPLNRMSNHVLAMEASGDLSRHIDMRSRDEVGCTVQAFNTLMRSMHSSISEINRVMLAVAGNDLTQRIQGDAKGDFNALKESINSSMHSLSQAMKLVGDNTQGVAVAANQTNQSIGQIAEDSQMQLDAVTQLSALIATTTAAMAKMAGDAETTCASARESASIVKAGRDKMEEMVGIAGKISDNSMRISRISKLIGGIASQTNLLSLNASIEAARAGEAGRGFAVVAEEIGKLAQTVASSVKEIADLVGEAMSDSKLAVEMASEVNCEMKKIEKVSVEAEALLQGISAAVIQQNTAMGEISGNARTLDSIAGRNAAAAQQISATSEGLSQLALQTRQQLDRFQLEDATA